VFELFARNCRVLGTCQLIRQKAPATPFLPHPPKLQHAALSQAVCLKWVCLKTRERGILLALWARICSSSSCCQDFGTSGFL